MLGCACLMQVGLRKLQQHRAMVWRVVSLMAGLTAIVAAVPLHSIWLLLAAALLDGAGLGLCFMGGISLVGAASPTASKAEVVSACYVITYPGESLPVLGVGYGADRLGLYPAVIAFASVIGAAGMLTAAFAARRGDAQERTTSGG